MKHDPNVQFLFNTISNAMRGLQGFDGYALRWFFAFGTLEEYIADLAFGLEYDIDVGVIYKECDSDALVDSVRSAGYTPKNIVRSDATGRPLKAQFSIKKEWPDLDVYFWIEHKGKLYHTYDEKREGTEVLKQYTFRGVEKEWLIPDKDYVEKLRTSAPEWDRLLDKNGVWHYDIFGDHSGFEFQCPFAYGSCLDTWYPVWRFRKYYRGNSMSPWTFTVKSCKGLC